MNHIKFCGCQACKAGMHRGGGFMVRQVTRRFRQRTKLALRRGDEPPAKMSVGYTD